MANKRAALIKQSTTCIDSEDMQRIWLTSSDDVRPVIPNTTSSGPNTLVNRHEVNKSPKNLSVTQDQSSVSSLSRQTSRETVNSFTSLSGQSLLMSEQDCSYPCVLRTTDSLYSDRISPKRSYQQLIVSASEGDSHLHKKEDIFSQMFSSKESTTINRITEESNSSIDSPSKLLSSGKRRARKYSDSTLISSRSSNSPNNVNGTSYSRHCQLMEKNTILSKHLNKETMCWNVSPTLRNINDRIGFGDEHKPARDVPDLKLRNKCSKLDALLANKHNAQEEVTIPEKRDDCSGFQIIASHPKIKNYSLSVIPEGKETNAMDINERLEVKSDIGVDLIMTNSEYENKYLQVTNISKKSNLYCNKRYNKSACTSVYSNQSLRLEEDSSASINVHRGHHPSSSTYSILKDRPLKDETSRKNTTSAATRHSDVKQGAERNASKKSMYLKKDCVSSHSKETGIISIKRSKVCEVKDVEVTSDRDILTPLFSTNIEQKDRRAHRKSARKHSEENILSTVDSISYCSYSESENSCSYSQCGDKGDAGSYSIERNHTHRAKYVGRTWKPDRALHYRRRSSSVESLISSTDTVFLEHDDDSIQNLQMSELQRMSKMSRDTSVSSSRNMNNEDSYTHLSVNREKGLTVNHTRISRNVSVKKFVSKSMGKISRHSSIHSGACTSRKSLRIEKSCEKQIEHKCNMERVCMRSSGNSILSKESDAYSRYRTCSEYSGYSSHNKSKKACSKHSDRTNKARRLSRDRAETLYSNPQKHQTDSGMENLYKTSLNTRTSVCCVTRRGESVIDINGDKKTEIKPQDLIPSASLKTFAGVAKLDRGVNPSDSVQQYVHKNKSDRMEHISKLPNRLETSNELRSPTIHNDDLTDAALTKDTPSREQSTTSINGTMLVESKRYKSYASVINYANLDVKSISSECNKTESKITPSVLSVAVDAEHKTIHDICSLEAVLQDAALSSLSSTSCVTGDQKNTDVQRTDALHDICNSKDDLQDAGLSSLSSTTTVTGEQKSSNVLSSHVLSLIQSESPLRSPRITSQGHHAHVRTSMRSINKVPLEAYRNQESTRKSNISLRSRRTISLSSTSKVADFISSKGDERSRRYDYSSSNEDSEGTDKNVSKTRFRRVSKPVQRRGVTPTKTRYVSGQKRCTTTRHVSYATSVIQTTNTECSVRSLPVSSSVKMLGTTSPLGRRTSRPHRRTHPKNGQHYCHLSQKNSRHVSNSPGGSFEKYGSSKHVKITNPTHQPAVGWSLKSTVQSWAKKVLDSTTWLKVGGSGKEDADMKKTTSQFNVFSKTCVCKDAYLKRRHNYHPRVKCSCESVRSQWSNQSEEDFKYQNSVRRGKHRREGEANKLIRAYSKIKCYTDDDDARRTAFISNEMRESETKIKERNTFYAREDKKENSVKREDFTKDISSIENDNLTLSERVDTYTRIGGGIKEKKWAITQINIFNDGSKTYAIGQQSKESPLKDAVKNVTRVFVTVPLPNGTTKDITY